jgi:alpha-D-ribose 1-methylphosphonate 5-triphosphate synthase subunit PhnG
VSTVDLSAVSRRQQWMSILASADRDALEVVCRPLGDLIRVRCQWLRAPETGLVMVRGRIGGSGAKFNLGEVPVTRCALRLQIEKNSSTGAAWVQGRDVHHAELAARIDALLQIPVHSEHVYGQVITPLAAGRSARRETAARKAAATKVEFYTLARESRAV